MATGHAETVARTPVVAGWVVDGLSRHAIHQKARDAWGIAPRTTDRLIAAARAELCAGWEVQRAEMVALLLERCDAAYAMAMEQKNSGAAIAAVGTMAKLAKL